MDSLVSTIEYEGDSLDVRNSKHYRGEESPTPLRCVRQLVLCGAGCDAADPSIISRWLVDGTNSDNALDFLLWSGSSV